MQTVLRCASVGGCPFPPRQCIFIKWQRTRRPPHHHFSHSNHRLQTDDTSALDHASLIDPLSLRNTLEAVRDANRATLIKKVGQYGRPTPLSTEPRPTGLLHHSWSIDETNAQDSPQGLRKVQNSTLRGRRWKLRGERTTRPELRKGDYGGKPYPIQSEWRIEDATGPRWHRPWMFRLSHADAKTPTDAKVQLQAEIHAFADYITPGPHEIRAAEAALRDIREALKSTKTSYSAELMGSRATGLASPMSDLDLNLTSAVGARLDEVEDRRRIVKVLDGLYRQLRRSKGLSMGYFVRRARVPIILGVHQRTGLEFQMQCTNSIYNSAQYTKTFLSEYPTLRSLFLVIKQMLKMRGLSIGPKGGLTSYPLLNMIVACLKLRCGHLDTNDVAGHLLSFLDMYSEIDFYTTGISVLPPALITLAREESDGTSADSDKNSSPTETPLDEHFLNLSRPSRVDTNHKVYLVDPADPSNNLGKSPDMIKHIQATLIDRRAMMLLKIQTWDPAVEDLSSRSLLACLLEGDYKTFELDRASLRRGSRSSLGWGCDDDGFESSVSEWDV